MSKRPVTTPEDWAIRLAGVNVTKEDLNAVIANYLFTEGYHSAAENFSREANISPPIDLESIETRMEIRRAVQSGNVEQATLLVNDLDPELLDTNPTLHFHLLQLHLIELIRQSRIPEALLFAQSDLAPRGEEHPQFLKELERTMALLAFEMPSLAPPSSSSTVAVVPSAPVPTPTSSNKKSKKDTSSTTDEMIPMPESISSLLDQSQRLKTAQELNAAILTAHNHGKDPKLPGLLKMLVWGEGLLAEKSADFPRFNFHDLLKREPVPSASNGDAMLL